MSSNEIAGKLDAFLRRYQPMREECHVVYLLVELRKIVEQQGLKMPLLKFYADWSVHSDKRFNMGDFRPIAESLYADAVSRLSTPGAVAAASTSSLDAFMNMDDIKNDVGRILTALRIDPALLLSSVPWEQFVHLLSGVLADQPIIRPSANVAEIRIDPSNRTCVLTFNPSHGPHGSFRHTRAKATPVAVPPFGTALP